MLHCLNEFNNIRILPDKELQQFISRFEQLYNRVQNAGTSLDEEHCYFKLIESLGDKYEYLAHEFEKCQVNKFSFKSLKDEVLREYF